VSKTWIVILGAAVRRGGEPSPALRRRVGAALAIARADDHFLPTGAVGRHPPSEAAVMQRLLVEAGVAPERIVLEERGTDTYSSLVHCARILRERGAERVVVCSDANHVPRAWLVLRALGVCAARAPARGDRRALGLLRWSAAVAHEVIATPWDVTLALLARARRR
jgi:vancomycin permeability regulator SanA